MGSADRTGLGKEGMVSFLRPFVLLEKQWLFDYFSEPVVKEMLQKFSVRGWWPNRKNGEHGAGDCGSASCNLHACATQGLVYMRWMSESPGGTLNMHPP